MRAILFLFWCGFLVSLGDKGWDMMTFEAGGDLVGGIFRLGGSVILGLVTLAAVFSSAADDMQKEKVVYVKRKSGLPWALAGLFLGFSLWGD